MISLKIMPIDKIIPAVNTENAMLFSPRATSLKNTRCNILKEIKRMSTDINIASAISIKARVNNLVCMLLCICKHYIPMIDIFKIAG